MLDGTLIFCSDSVLRFRSISDDKTAYPLPLVQQAMNSEDDDPFFLLGCFDLRVSVERGTTLANILIALEPWKALLGAYLKRDVEAYIDEVRKPVAVADYEQNIEWIGIYRATDVYRQYRYDDHAEAEDFASFFNREREPTDEFRIDSSCEAAGFRRGGDERYSLSEGIHRIKNLPVHFIDKASVGGYIGKENPLFNTEVSGIHSVDHGSFIVGGTSFTFREVIEAIFWSGLFFHSPRDAEDAVVEVKAALSALADHLEDEDTAEEADTDARKLDDEPKKVVVLPGAFDAVKEHYDHEARVWSRVKELSRDVAGAPVRIGKIDEATPPEVRLHGKLLSDSLPSDHEPSSFTSTSSSEETGYKHLSRMAKPQGERGAFTTDNPEER